MKNDKIVLILNEVRTRINQLSEIEKTGYFYREVARLTEWLNSIKIFREPLQLLDLIKQSRDGERISVLNSIYLEGKNIWKIISKVNLDVDGVDDIVRDSYVRLKHLYGRSESNPSYSIGIYHNLRYVVEYLATHGESKLVNKLVNRDNQFEYPNISGQIYKYFLEFQRQETQFKNQLLESTWGAWDYMNYVVYLSKDKEYPQLKEWSEVFEVDEYKVHLHKVADYLFDYFVLNYKEEHPAEVDFEKFAVWDDDFKFEDNILSLGKYGRVTFNPNKSPAKNNTDDQKVSDQTIFLQNLVTVGKEGILKTKLASMLEIDVSGITPLKQGINKTIQNSIDKGNLNATVRVYEIGERGLKTIKLLIVPINLNDNID